MLVVLNGGKSLKCGSLVTHTLLDPAKASYELCPGENYIHSLEIDLIIVTAMEAKTEIGVNKLKIFADETTKIGGGFDDMRCEDDLSKSLRTFHLKYIVRNQTALGKIINLTLPLDIKILKTVSVNIKFFYL